LVDAIDAMSEDRSVADVPTGYDELAGGGLDKALGGDGESGQIVGGLLQGVVSGKLITLGMQSASAAGEDLLLGPMGDGIRNATLGLEVVSTSHSIANASGLMNLSNKQTNVVVDGPRNSSRFEPVLNQPDW
jgi:hypothetical protein